VAAGAEVGKGWGVVAWAVDVVVVIGFDEVVVVVVVVLVVEEQAVERDTAASDRMRHTHRITLIDQLFLKIYLLFFQVLKTLYICCNHYYRYTTNCQPYTTITCNDH
jgi:glucose uptake protein GlcU